eukprot:SAG31_NODE_4926_length_2859_cov_110.767029_4_plen_96_part_00
MKQFFKYLETVPPCSRKMFYWLYVDKIQSSSILGPLTLQRPAAEGIAKTSFGAKVEGAYARSNNYGGVETKFKFLEREAKPGTSVTAAGPTRPSL